MAQRDGKPPVRACSGRKLTSEGAPDPQSLATGTVDPSDPQSIRRPPGRPPRRLPAVARYTIRLDAERHDALLSLSADDGDRSLHSIVMEAIDDYIRKRGFVSN